MRKQALCGFAAYFFFAACGTKDSSPVRVSTPQVSQVQLQVVHRQGARALPSFAWIAREGLPRFAGPQEAATAVAKNLKGAFELEPGAADAVKFVDIQAAGTSHIANFAQRVDGVEVFRSGVHVLVNRDFEPISVSGLLAPSLVGSTSPFVLGEGEALDRAHRALTDRNVLASKIDVVGEYHRFAIAGLTQLARVKRVWFPHVNDAAFALTPGYYVEMMFASGPAWSFVIAADSGEELFRHNLVKNEAFSYRVFANATTLFPMDGPQGVAMTPHSTGQIDGQKLTMVSPQLVTLQNFPFSKNDPWLSADSVQTKGNNVDAYSDASGASGFDATDIRAGITSPRTFDHTYVPSLQPNANATQVQASITHMFFITNFMHDWFYDSGFDEAAGNHQLNNFGRGGKSNDPVLAEIQDSSGRNNANAATPADGASARIQMYVFSGTSNADLTVLTPTAIAGVKQVGLASGFGKDSFLMTGDVVVADDGQGSDAADACEPIVNNVTGKIVLVHRGICSFFQKAQNGQTAGAAGVIIANVATSSSPTNAPFMGGTGLNVTIPVLSLNLADGQALELATTTGASVTMKRELQTDLDGALDTSVVAHEWGHTLSNRLIGNGSGLTYNQAGGLGEGWSDFVAMLVMASEEDTKTAAGANWNGVYPNGAYAMSGSGADFYFGIRRVPYSVDFTKNALTFKHIQNGNPLPSNVPTSFGEDGSFNSEVHSTGEVWATILWECYVGLLRDPRHTFAQAQDLMKKYLVAGLKLTPVEPTLLEARDAMFAAAAANDEADYVTFLRAFARRGAGIGATGPAKESPDNATVKESYYAGNAITLVGATLSDDGVTCDRDGFLDVGETGTIKVTVRNSGVGALSAATAKFTSSVQGITFGNGGVVSVGALKPFETKVVTNTIHLRSDLVVEDAKVLVAVSDPSIESGRSLEVTIPARNNVDEVPDTSASDSVDTRETAWVVSHDKRLGETPSWTRVSTSDHKNTWWTIPNAMQISDHMLTSPPFSVGDDGFTLEFKHRWSFRYSTRRNVDIDGGVIELSTDGKTWRDLSELGTIDYNTSLETSSRTNNPLKGRRAYGHKSAGYPDAWVKSTIGVKLAEASDNVRIRFRAATTDGYGGAPGWDVDDIALIGTPSTPFWSRTKHRDGCDENAPVANAGPPQTVTKGAGVSLAGTGSDPAGGAVTFEWIQIAGPLVTMTGDTTNAPTFVAPDVTASTVVTLALRVSNGTLLSPASTVDVTVNPVDPRETIGGGGGCSHGSNTGGTPYGSFALLGVALMRLRRRR